MVSPQPGIARVVCVCGRTPMQAGSGASSSSSSSSQRTSVLLHVVLLCVCMQQQQRLTPTKQKAPCTHPPTSRQDLLVEPVLRFLRYPAASQRGIPFYYTHISPSLCAGVVIFSSFSFRFLGRRLAHDWPAMSRGARCFWEGYCPWDISAFWGLRREGRDAYMYACILSTNCCYHRYGGGSIQFP